jgi:hypothetical protein
MNIYISNKKALSTLFKKIKSRKSEERKEDRNMINALKHIIQSMEEVYDIK